MKVIPVLDLLDGCVVRGVAGRRSEYRPIVSQRTGSSEPLVVARAIRDAFGLCEFYIADLDGILRHQPKLAVYRQLMDDGFQLLVDAGVRHFVPKPYTAEAMLKILHEVLSTEASEPGVKP